MKSVYSVEGEVKGHVWRLDGTGYLVTAHGQYYKGSAFKTFDNKAAAIEWLDLLVDAGSVDDMNEVGAIKIEAIDDE